MGGGTVVTHFYKRMSTSFKIMWHNLQSSLIHPNVQGVLKSQRWVKVLSSPKCADVMSTESSISANC